MAIFTYVVYGLAGISFLFMLLIDTKMTLIVFGSVALTLGLLIGILGTIYG